MSHLTQRLELLRYPAFRLYLTSCLLVTFGAGLGYITMTWMAMTLKNSIGSVAISMLCFWGPGVILGPLMGILVDRVRYRSRLLAASNWIRAVALLGFGLYFMHRESLVLLYLLIAIQGVFFSIWIPAAVRLTREMVPQNKLSHANATIDMTFEGGSMVGMGFAGLIIAWLSAPAALLINAGMFILSGTSLISIKAKDLTIYHEEHVKINVVSDFINGLRYIASNKAIYIIYSIQLLIFLEYLTAPVLMAPFALNVLHTDVKHFGYIEMALSAGVVSGGLFLAWIAEVFGLTRTLLVSSVILGISYIVFSYNRSIVEAEIIYFIIGVCFATWPLVVTRAQNITDIHFQGRVLSCFTSISGLLMILIYLAVKLTSTYISIQIFYWIEVVFTLLSIWLILVFDRSCE